MSEKILEVRNLKKYFPLADGRSVKAVDGVSLDLYKGETLGLVGESGCGKSTIAYTIIGMYGATGGEILYEGDDLVKKKKRTLTQKGEIQIVFQDPGSSLNSRRSIGKSLAVPLDIHDPMGREEKDRRIEALLEMVGLPKLFKDKMPRNIGGGERQLVGVARALATRPKLIILDEPTSALDVSVQAKVIGTLLDLQKKMELSYLFITHDLSLMRNVATRVAILYLGLLCELAATEEEEKMKPAAVSSEGEIPSPINAPKGCAFHTRCRDCMEICGEQAPEMTQVAPGHFVCCHIYAAKEGHP